MYTHADLAANVWTNPFEIPGNGIDDDGNGYVDDVHGWDFDGNNNTTYDGTERRPRHARRRHHRRGRRQRRRRGRRQLERDASSPPSSSASAAAPRPTRSRRVDYFTDLKIAPRPQHRGHQQLLGRRRLLAGAAATRSSGAQRGQHPLRRRGRQRRQRRRGRQQRRHCPATRPTTAQRERHRGGLHHLDRGASRASPTTAPPRWTSARRAPASSRRCRANKASPTARTAAPRWRRRT